MSGLFIIVAAVCCMAVLISAAILFRLGRKKKVRKRYGSPASLSDGKRDVRHGIPGLLHRIWIGPRVFPPFKDLRWIESFEKENSDFTPLVWKDADVRRLIAEKYPEYEQLYSGYRLNIQRADLARYLVLYEYGGMYADLDMSAMRPVRELLENYPKKGFFSFVEIVLSEKRAREIGEGEPIRKEGHRRGWNEIPEDPERIASYAFLCAPGHPVMLEILKEAGRRAGLPVKRQYDVYYTTGPDLFTTVVHRCMHDGFDVTMIDKTMADEFMLHHGSATWKTFINFGFH
jgi:mannosyltransferase OCH1-like enzyme